MEGVGITSNNSTGLSDVPKINESYTCMISDVTIIGSAMGVLLLPYCRIFPVSLQTEKRFNVQTQRPRVLNMVSWGMKAAEGGGAVLVELEPGGSGREVSGRPSR
jgi:hypothetical protein